MTIDSGAGIFSHLGTSIVNLSENSSRNMNSYVERALAFPLADGGGVVLPFIELEFDVG